METTTKICTKCKIEKSINEFYKCHSKNDGYTNSCILCAKIYREKNKEKLLKQKKEYYYANKEKIAARHAIYRSNNKEMFIEYRIKNKNRTSSYNKAYRDANASYFSEYHKEYYKKNKKSLIEKSKKYQGTEIGKMVHKNKEHKRRSIKKDGDVATNQLEELYQNTKTCYWCNAKLMKGDIHLDHYTPLSKGGLHTISNLVLSCSKCNLKKSAKDPLLFAQEMGRLL